MIQTKPTIQFADTLAPESRVWVYQGSRPFTAEEQKQLAPIIDRFAEGWVSHNRQLKAKGYILLDQFIVLMVDESQAGASGCSIDKSVHFVQAIEREFQINLFDRMTFTVWQDDQVKTFPRAAFKAAYTEGQINDQTFVFNPLVNTKMELENRFICTLEESWHKRMVG